jgi:hypothetical protein
MPQVQPAADPDQAALLDRVKMLGKQKLELLK